MVPDNTDVVSDEKLCGGCGNSVESDTGGIVVAFGNGLWHVECFRCAKCTNRVDADTNLLLLSDGSPVCTNCSYNCSSCHKPILDEAIMTGEEAYHAKCFKCRSCHQQIEELVFAKTKAGIYCMACHGVRVAKSRKYAEKKAMRDKDRKMSEGTLPTSTTRSSHSKERDRDYGGDRKAPSPSHAPSQSPEPRPPHVSRSQSSPTPNSGYNASGPPSSPGNATFDSSISPIGTPVELEMDAHRVSVVDKNAQSQRQYLSSAPSSENYITAPTTPSQRRSVASDQSLTTAAAELANQHNRNGMFASERYSNSLSTSPTSPTFSPPPPQNRRASADSGVPYAHRNSRSSLTESINPVTGTPRRRSFNPLDVIIDGMKRPYTPRTKQQRPGDASEDINGDIPDALKEYFEDSHSRMPELGTKRRSAGETRSVTAPAVIPGPNGAGKNRDGRRSFLEAESSSGGDGEEAYDINPRPASASVTTSFAESGGNMTSNTHRRRSSASAAIKKEDEGWEVILSPSEVPVRSGSLPLNQLHSYGPLPRSPRDKEHEPSPSGVPTNVTSASETDEDLVSSPPRDKLHDRDREDRSKSPLVPKRSQRRPQSLLLFSTSSPPLVPEEVELETDSGDAAGNDNDATYRTSPKSHEISEIREESEMVDTPPALPPIRISHFFIDSAVGNGGKKKEKEKEPAILEEPKERPSSSATVNGNGTITITRPLPPPQVVIEDNESHTSSTRSSTRSHNREASVTTAPSSSRRPAVPAKDRAITNSPYRGGGLKGKEKEDFESTVLKSLRDVLADANKRATGVVKLDKKFVEAIYASMEGQSRKYAEMRDKMDVMKRASQQFADGFSATQVEYDRELASRRDAETEIRRLRALVQEQSAKLSGFAAESRKREMLEKSSRDMTDSLVGLEKDLSKLKVERDLTIAEVAELSASKSGELAPASETSSRISVSISSRLDSLKVQYRQELQPLTEQRELLVREINDLKESRNAVLDETATLHARNEELSDLNAQIARSIENSVDGHIPQPPSPRHTMQSQFTQPTGSGTSGSGSSPMFSKLNASMLGLSTTGYTSSEPVTPVPADQSHKLVHKTSRHLNDVAHDNARGGGGGGLFKWGTKPKDGLTPTKMAMATSVQANGLNSSVNGSGSAKTAMHSFTQQSLLRVTRCDQCCDKMWGSQARCLSCGISVHPRCIGQVQRMCTGNVTTSPGSGSEELPPLPPPPSMFGRYLVEQVHSDSQFQGTERFIPIIVEKCVDAVQALAMDYEGVYRKSGGSSQTKAITQLFERGEYDSIDLLDSRLANDISSITSVLKSYFRALPDPLLTHALHESFIDAATVREGPARYAALNALVTELPKEHYETLKCLMMHLYKVQERQSENRMDAKNLGMVFGPTLMRSSEPSREFGDMAGKAQCVEWLVANAPSIFRDKSFIVGI